MAAPPSAGSDTPGKWRHPQLNEIVRRQNAATFGDKNLRKVIWNGGALLMSWIFGHSLKTKSVSRSISPCAQYTDCSLFKLTLHF